MTPADNSTRRSVNKRSLIACTTGVFVGVFLFQVFMMLEFTMGFIETLQFIFTFELVNRLINTSIITMISLLIIISINPEIIFIKKPTDNSSTKEARK